MRTFKLYNSDKSANIDLNSPNNFAYNWQGLGLDYDLTFVDTSNNSYLNNLKLSRKDIKCTILFQGNAYSNYNTFKAFILANGKNNFVLETNDGIQIIDCDVYIKSLPKSEKTEYNAIESEVVFIPNKGWYQEIIYTPAGVPKTGNRMYFSQDFENTNFGDTPLKVEINSSKYTNPYINTYYISSGIDIAYVDFSNGKDFTPYLVIGTEKLPVGTSRSQTLIVDGISQKITLKSLVVNQTYDYYNYYGKQVMTKDSFIHAPIGNIRLRVDQNADNTTQETATVKITYRRYI